jgi:hypothetical protein
MEHLEKHCIKFHEISHRGNSTTIRRRGPILIKGGQQLQAIYVNTYRLCKKKNVSKKSGKEN